MRKPCEPRSRLAFTGFRKTELQDQGRRDRYYIYWAWETRLILRSILTFLFLLSKNRRAVYIYSRNTINTVYLQFLRKILTTDIVHVSFLPLFFYPQCITQRSKNYALTEIIVLDEINAMIRCYHVKIFSIYKPHEFRL